NVYAYSVDDNENGSETVSETIKIDKNPPTRPTINFHPIDWTNDNAYFTVLDGSDTVSGIMKSQYRIGDGPWVNYNSNSEVTVTDEGEISIYARTFDNAGNIS
ncbi:hypothetical protein KIH86_00360, partial [Paenibacillus sp. HN-1]